MILSHIEYCFTNWSFACATNLKPIEQLYERAIKVFDRKPYSYHHSTILEKHHFLSFDKCLLKVCFFYKCWGGRGGSDVPVQVQPVAGDVHTHADLEQEGVGGVEQRQVDQQTHGGTAVRQHVHHRPELSG